MSLPIENLQLVEDLYKKYLENPESIDPSWRYFFQGMDFRNFLQIEPVNDIRNAYRKWGHLIAQFNPMEKGKGSLEGVASDPEMEVLYTASIGYEFMDLGRPDVEKWLIEQIEGPRKEIGEEKKNLLLECMAKAENFESFLHSKYVGQTRFSLEGAETLIPLLAEIIEVGSEEGIEEVFLGMAHRGRLNVLTSILNKPYSTIFEEFEDDTALSLEGNDDVKYHMGFVGNWKNVIVEMAANPSHLESVDPVVLGEVKAKQILKDDREKKRILPVLIHGDASLAGQGVIYESLQLMNLPNYSVGGTIHIVVNNQIGYTTLSEEGRSTRYCTDIAKAFGCPVFHVNAEDPESCLFVADLAARLRQKFHLDVFIDLVCYRKYGHNEGDEPSFTQPLLYQQIRSRLSIRELYAEKYGFAKESSKEELEKALEEAREKIAKKKTLDLPAAWDPFAPVASGVDEKHLRNVIDIFCKVPKDFHPHPKLHKWLDQRAAQLDGQVNWATAECLALGSLLLQGTSIRLAGQDSQRGTFSQRHMVWMDVENGLPYCPFKTIPSARFDVVNSPLTEFAGMGFEYGYSQKSLDSLVLWEAQYGDFNNGAQIIIDQYIASGEKKWNSLSSLVLLLPHGYEGAGPEHSSARLERFLQLAANGNMRIVNPSTPAQYFHLLRRQVLSQEKKPLIIFTPKSLLRAKGCVSELSDFTGGFFHEILDDATPATRLVLCSGKIYYDLLNVKKRSDVAIVRIEQLYPLDVESLKKYQGIHEVVWVQEEPQNMGAWSYLEPILRELFPKLSYVGRKASAATATGSGRKSKQEQMELLAQANI